MQVEGNKEVQACLARWKAEAEKGRLNYIVIVACEGSTKVSIDHTGLNGNEFAANWGLDAAKQKIMNGLHIVPDNVQASADRVCWDAPSCYDFIPWLVQMEMTRRREKGAFPLKVGFGFRALQREVMFENVVYPALAFVKAVVDPTAINGRQVACNTYRPIVEAGEDVPLLIAPDCAVVSDRVTITLREAEHWPHRNSNIPEWLKFAEYLEDQGERVLFIRDTAHANEKITGYEIYPEASIDINVRLALYEQSKCNLFVSNGPHSLAVFGTRPWLAFIEVDPNSPCEVEKPQFWQQYHGIDPLKNEQLPWSRPDQRIIWKRDSYENLVEAWCRLPLKGVRAAADRALPAQGLHHG